MKKKTKKVKETKLQELERRIAQLEGWQRFGSSSPPPPAPNWPPNYHNPNLHYHGAIPCYNNPCLWC